MVLGEKHGTNYLPYTQILTDTEKSLHRWQCFAIFNPINITRVLSQRKAHFTS